MDHLCLRKKPKKPPPLRCPDFPPIIHLFNPPTERNLFPSPGPWEKWGFWYMPPLLTLLAAVVETTQRSPWWGRQHGENLLSLWDGFGNGPNKTWGSKTITVLIMCFFVVFGCFFKRLPQWYLECGACLIYEGQAVVNHRISFNIPIIATTNIIIPPEFNFFNLPPNLKLILDL